MEQGIPDYVEARIRQRPPQGINIVPGSTPVVAFGDFRTASVATLGLNPSSVEFLDHDRAELTDGKRRLETLGSLGVSDLETAPSDAVQKVFEACTQYFQPHPYGNPYCRWFNALEAALKPLGVSYYNGTACHLDIVQWATYPTWGKLPRNHKRDLVKSDRSFLDRQLAHEHIRLLLVNGAGALNTLGWTLTPTELIRGEGKSPRLQLLTGQPLPHLRVIGWNLNLQSSYGVTNDEKNILIDAVIKASRSG
jgi:hypothetical protein